MRRSGPFFLALLLAANGARADTTAANQPTPVVAQTTSNAIRDLLNAMQDGDVHSATQFYQTTTDPIAHVWSAMVIERIHFNLDAASKDAQLCEGDLLESHPHIALLCGQFRSGNLRLAGRRTEADEVERILIKRFQGHGVDKDLAAMQAYLDGVSRLPVLTYAQTENEIALPLEATSWQPSFKASANGHDLNLMLDTGASDLVLGTEQASAFGVQLLDKQQHVSGWLSRDIPSQRGVLDTLKFGEITLRHVPVTIVPRSTALIGANLVAPLGSLRISRMPAALTFYGSATHAPPCDSPLLTGSNLWGTTLRIYPEIRMNDMPHAVLLDTGAGRYLIGTQAALNEVTLLHRSNLVFGDIGGMHSAANAEHAKVKLTIAGQPIDMYFDVLTDATERNGITLGAGALRDMDFLLDFRHQRQCFLLHPDLH